MFARTFAAVLFDLDGTLISSLRAVERSWGQWFEEYAIAPDRRHVRHGVPAHTQVDDLLPDRSPAERDAAARRIDAIELADTDGIEVLPGARSALAVLTAAGRCAVVTGCNGPLAAARLGATGLPVPAVVVTADDAPRGKPYPDSFRLGAAALGVAPADCLVVEDAPAGLAAARAAGCATLALTSTFSAADLDADVIVADLAAVRFVPTGDGVRLAWVGAAPA